MWRSAVQVCLGLRIALVAVRMGHDVPVVRRGGLAQLARALAWHARGHRFDPDILHHSGSACDGSGSLLLTARCPAAHWKTIFDILTQARL